MMEFSCIPSNSAFMETALSTTCIQIGLESRILGHRIIIVLGRHLAHFNSAPFVYSRRQPTTIYVSLFSSYFARHLTSAILKPPGLLQTRKRICHLKLLFLAEPCFDITPHFFNSKVDLAFLLLHLSSTSNHL